MIVRNSAKCLLCDTEIESIHRHDFVTCPCGNLSVDGGHDYLKRLFNSKPSQTPTFEDTSITRGNDFS